MRLVAATVLACLLAVPATAAASFPGRNGLLAVTEDVCESVDRTYIRAYRESGGRSFALTPECERYETGFTPVARETWGPDWSPDGTRLLYGQSGGGDEPARFETRSALGTDERAVSPPRRALSRSYNQPSFAPDGRRFVFFDRGSLWIAPGDGGEPTELRPARDFHVGVKWSPTGRHLAVVRVGTAPGLWLLDARDGRSLRRVARGDIASFDWSPDGSRLVFATDGERNEVLGHVEGANLYVVRASGGLAPALFLRTRDVAAINPVWSPDGRSIAWVRVEYTPGDVAFDVITSLWRRRVAGGRATKIADVPSPRVEEGFHALPDLAWQPRPRP